MCVQIRSSIFRTFIKGTPDPQCPLIQAFFIIRKKVDFSPHSANPHEASPFLPLPLRASLHSDYMEASDRSRKIFEIAFLYLMPYASSCAPVQFTDVHYREMIILQIGLPWLEKRSSYSVMIFPFINSSS